MSRADSLGAVEYAAETLTTGWAEVSTTYGARYPILGKVDFSGLTHNKVKNPATVQYMGDGAEPILMTKGGSIKLDMHIPGHGTTTAGAISLKNHETLMGYAIGRAAATGAGTTFTGGTVTAPTTTSSGVLAAGQIIWAGSYNDAKGDGQPAVIGTVVTTTVNLLTALPAAPVNTDVCYGSVMIYPDEDVATSEVQNIRLRGLTANQQMAMRGCWAMSSEIAGFNATETPKASTTWGVSTHDPVSATFPSATAIEGPYLPSASAGGSLFVQAVGTTTRQTYSYRDFALNISMPVQADNGPGGIDPAQTTTSAKRLPHEVTVSFTVDAQTASATPTWPVRFAATTRYHLLFSANNAATGKRVAVYLPNACFEGSQIMQSSSDGINRERITLRGYTGTDTTSALTKSSFRIALG